MIRKMREESLFPSNRLICGDNLEVLPTLPSESIDLIYIDPPFFSNRNYEVIWGDASEIRSFEDRWEGGIEHYISWMKERVIELHQILKPTGSLYLHCDWHANAHLRIMMDEIFGPNNFRNEIVWCYSTSGRGKREFSKKHDTILFYSKTNKYLWNDKEVKIPYSEEYIKSHFRDKDEKGKKCRKRYDAGKWRIYYPDEGMIPNDWWIIPYVNSMAKERLGYPTQKPEALLERIIKASSNKGDVVLDAFCGCGTTLSAAQRLQRRWIGIDISPSAISLVKRRLARLGVQEGVNLTVIGMPTSQEDLRKLKPLDFQSFITTEIMAIPSRRKVGDFGIDALSGPFPPHLPIQIKQQDNVGRNVVDNFETALRRKNEEKGYIIGFSFTKGAIEEVARIRNKGEFGIQLVKIEEILKEGNRIFRLKPN